EFEMNISAVFHFKDGRSVFTGLIKDGTALENGEKVKIVVDGEQKQVVEVHTMFTTPPSPNGQQSLSTNDKVFLTKELVEKHNCKLVGIKG
ncbi:MAG: hypothetical protein ACRC80_19235, partial [Waterburya sp.]